MTAATESGAAGAAHAQPPVTGSVLLFAALGYLYIAVVLAVGVVVSVLLVRAGAPGLAVVAAGFLLVLVLSLWVIIPVPEGRRVTRDEAPRLYRAIDRARAQLRAPEVDVVILGTALNAAVLERPRFGVFGPRERYLEVGMPLLHAMPEAEVRAILAHEFAHLSRQHSRGHLWLVRAAVTWHNLVASLQSANHWGRFLFLPFFRWYTPRLEMLTQAASRAHEYESDRLAARAMGAEVMGRALLRLAVGTVTLEREVMQGILRSSAEHPAPPPDVFAVILDGVRTRPDPAALDEALRSVLRERSLDVDSHPSLCERLAALGHSTELAALRVELAMDEPPAVDALLEPAFAREVADELGAAWCQAAARAWEGLHTDARVWREAGLDEAGAVENADRAALLAHARWAFTCEPPRRAVPLLRSVLKRAPNEPEPSALLGRLLVQENDEPARAEGVALLEREAARPSLHAQAALEALREHYARAGDHAALARLRARDLALRDEELRGLSDRQTLRAGDSIRAYPLPPSSREALVRALEEQPAVHRAFLVEKQTRLLAESPVVVLAVQLKVPFFRLTSGSLGTRVCEALLPHVHLPETRDLLVMQVRKRSRLLRRLRRTAGAEVYRRGEVLPAPSAVGEWSAPRGVWGRRAVAGAILGAVLMGLAFAVRGGGEENDEQRLAKLRRAASERPTSVRANRRLAEELVKQKRWDEAEGALERAARLDPGNWWLHNALGWKRMQGGEFSQALAPLRRAAALDPDNLYPMRNLGWALFSLDSLDQAERVYRRAVRVHPDDSGAHSELGMVLLAMHRLEEAESQFTRAARLEPDDAYSVHRLGIVQLRLGRLDTARATLGRAAALDPRNPLVWADLGHLEHLTGEYAASAAAFQRAHELDPTYFASEPYRRGMWEASRAGRQYQP